jgi:hypothetical protein
MRREEDLAGEVFAVVRDAPGSLTPDTIRRILRFARGIPTTNGAVEAALAELHQQGRVTVTGEGRDTEQKVWRAIDRWT